jgi:hypothetical protein
MTEDSINEITHSKYKIVMVLGCDSQNFAFTVMETQKNKDFLGKNSTLECESRY